MVVSIFAQVLTFCTENVKANPQLISLFVISLWSVECILCVNADGEAVNKSAHFLKVGTFYYGLFAHSADTDGALQIKEILFGVRRI